MKIWAILILLAAPLSAQSFDPAALLGMSVDHIRAAYPGECKKLREARSDELPMDNSLRACSIKHHPKQLFGEKFSSITLFFKEDRLIESDIKLKGGAALLELLKQYGNPDPPLDGPSSSYRFGTLNTDNGNESTTIDGIGESHYDRRFWTKSKFTIFWSSSSYMSFDDMVHRDHDLLGGLFYRPDITETVSFSSR